MYSVIKIIIISICIQYTSYVQICRVRIKYWDVRKCITNKRAIVGIHTCNKYDGLSLKSPTEIYIIITALQEFNVK